MPTFRRPAMLRGAIASLVAQDFEDWICEVRNNDPDSAHTVAEVVASFGDARLTLVHNEANFGALRNFNGCFRPIAEEFYSILEDDNVWKSNFLSEMLRHLRQHPEVRFAWSNQDLRYETDEGWRVTSETVHPTAPDDPPELVHFGDRRQILGALHANGAILVRSDRSDDFRLPEDLPIAAMELFRDRMLPYPLLYVPQPLATFSITRATVRPKSVVEWTAIQAMTAASFLSHGSLSRSEFAGFLEEARKSSPPSTNSLLLGCLLAGKSEYTRAFHASDWLHLAQAMLHHPSMALTLSIKRRRRTWWDFISSHTARQFRRPPESAGAQAFSAGE